MFPFSNHRWWSFFHPSNKISKYKFSPYWNFQLYSVILKLHSIVSSYVNVIVRINCQNFGKEICTYNSLTISRYDKEIGKNLVVGEYSDLPSSNCQLLSKMPRRKLNYTWRLWIAITTMQRASYRQGGPSCAFLLGVDRLSDVYLLSNRKSRLLARLFERNPWISAKIITQFFNNNEQQSRLVRKTCYPFFSFHLATFEGKEFREYLSRIFSITSSKLSK